MQCESVDDIFKKNGFASNVNLSAEDLKKILPSVFARIQNPFCYKATVKKEVPKKTLGDPAGNQFVIFSFFKKGVYIFVHICCFAILFSAKIRYILRVSCQTFCYFSYYF